MQNAITSNSRKSFCDLTDNKTTSGENDPESGNDCFISHHISCRRKFGIRMKLKHFGLVGKCLFDTTNSRKVSYI